MNETKKLIKKINKKRNGFNYKLFLKSSFYPVQLKSKTLKNGCIILTSHENIRKYPYINYQGKHTLITHIFWESKYGKIKDKNKCVLHKCDNRECININHLFLGTRKDNNLDCKNKGRNAKGEHHGLHKLTLKQVRKIRKLWDIKIKKEYSKNSQTHRKYQNKKMTIRKYKVCDLAKMFNVSRSTISYIVFKYKNWSWYNE